MIAYCHLLSLNLNRLSTGHWTANPNACEKRLVSSMEDIRAFYSVMLGRVEEALDYLNGFTLGQLPEPEQRLLNMTLALAEIWVAVELYKQPDHPFGLDMRRFVPGEATSVPSPCPD